ncbi:MAG: MCE family protein [Porphyromonadaceae bacterium]|nr:MCE family protein [Porphyromonadaceae bacterium]
MKKDTKRAFRVGTMVFTALAIFAVVIYLIGSKDNLFHSKTRITTSFNDIRGVIAGNNVRYSGINVGKVNSIEITSDSTVVLVLDIVKEYARFIYQDALVEINQHGLMGSKLLNITSGTAASGQIQDGTHLKGKEGIDIEGMLGKTQDILSQTSDAVESLKSIAQKIDLGQGDLGKLINEDMLYTNLLQTTQNLNNTLAGVDNITRKISSGEGDLARLLNKNELTTQTYSVLGNINQAADKAQQVVTNLETTTSSINSGEGTINMLLNNQKTAQNIDTTILKLQNTLTEFDKTAKAIQDSWIVRLFSKKKKKNKEKEDSSNQITEE